MIPSPLIKIVLQQCFLTVVVKVNEKEKIMSQIIEIMDFTQKGPDVYSGLTDSRLRNRSEPDTGIFIAESPKVIGRALDYGCKPVSFLMGRKHIDGDACTLIARCPDVPVYTADSRLLEQLTGFNLTRGVLCAMRRFALPSVQDVCAAARRIAVLEDITESTNVGTIFRSAAALGIDAVLVTPACCDPLCRRSVRVSMGNVFNVPWTRTGSSPDEWPGQGMNLIKSLGFKTVAMALRDDSIRIDDARLTAEKKLAIILGTEGDGLQPETIAGCDYTVRIPMSHHVDSLNVGSAAAIAFWQLGKK